MENEKVEKRRQYMKEYNEKYKLIHAERMKDPEYRALRREQRAKWKKWTPTDASKEHLLAYKKAYYLQNKKAILERQKSQKLKKREEMKREEEMKKNTEQTTIDSFCIILE